MQTRAGTRCARARQMGAFLLSSLNICYSSEVLLPFQHGCLSKMILLSSDHQEFQHLLQSSQSKYSQSLFMSLKLSRDHF